MTEKIAALNQQFAIADTVRFIERGGHAIVAIRAHHATAEIALQGAQVLSWQPTGQPDVLWCAPLPPAQAGKAIRGGVPICWPWFGPHATDKSQPQHGLVRTVDWQLQATNATPEAVHIALTHDAFGCRLRFDVHVGARLTLALTTTNTSTAPVTITEALHSYVHVSDVTHCAVHGLDGATYRDNTDGAREKNQNGPVLPRQETVSVFPSTPDTCEIEDPGLKRQIRITRKGGRSTIVWHPGASVSTFADIPADMASTFLCVESANVAPHAVTLLPGATHHLQVTFEVISAA